MTTRPKTSARVPLLDARALRTMAAAVRTGTAQEMAACRSCLDPLFQFLYEDDSIRTAGVACGRDPGLEAKYRHLSRFPCAPRIFAVFTVRGKVLQLMLSAVPEESVLGGGLTRFSRLEVIDVGKAPFIRYLLWLGKQLFFEEYALQEIFFVSVMPLLLETFETPNVRHEIQDAPIGEIVRQLT